MPTTSNASVPAVHLPPAAIDTVALSLPVLEVDHLGATSSTRDVGLPSETVTFRRKLPRGGFMAWGIGSTVWLEASLPKRAGGDNLDGVSTRQAWELLADLVDEAGEWANLREPGAPGIRLAHGMSDVRGRAGTFVEAKVVRLDLVRDFDGVASAPFLLDGLAGVPVKGRSKVRRYADAERNRAETLTVGPRAAWRATLYDKHAETLGGDVVAPEGRLRYEARMRSDLLTSQWAKSNGGHVLQVMDLEEQRLQALTFGMFERVGFGSAIEGDDRLAEAVFSAPGLSRAEARNLWAFLTVSGRGVDPGFSRPVRYKYRRMAEDLGIILRPWDLETRSASVRLDYERGTEALVLAV